MRLENQRSEEFVSRSSCSEVLQPLFRSPHFAGPQVRLASLLQDRGRTRVDHCDVCLNRFMNSWVEDNVGLESLLGVLVGQTRVLARSYTMQASERHETTLQHVVSREFFLAIDGVFNVKFWFAWTAALVRHVREGLSSCVRHREAHLFVSESKLLRQWVRLPEQS